MPAAKNPRIAVVTRLGEFRGPIDGLREYAALEYRSEDPLWLWAQLKAPATPRPPRSGWLSRVLGGRLSARSPRVEPETAVEAIAP